MRLRTPGMGDPSDHGRRAIYRRGDARSRVAQYHTESKVERAIYAPMLPLEFFCKNILTSKDHGDREKLNPGPSRLGPEEGERTARLFWTLPEMEVIHDGRNHTTGPTRPAQGGRRQFAQAAQSAASCMNQALNPRTVRCQPAQRASKEGLPQKQRRAEAERDQPPRLRDASLASGQVLKNLK